MTLTKDWLQKFGWPETLLTGHPLAIAHRGACDYAPENTLKAFGIAADLCAELWELDIRMSADGVCVVAHDDNLTRVAGRGLRVSEANWNEISSLQLPEGQHISKLQDVIKLAQKRGCGLYIEIKAEGAGMAAWKLLENASFRFAAISSFNPAWISDLRDHGCDYPLGIMVPTGADPYIYLSGVHVDIIHPCWRDASEQPHELLTDELMQQFSDHSHQIVIWHEDRASVLEALWHKQVMGICSNRPELLKPYRQDQKHPIDVVCHRGANNLAPENTLEAARICVDQLFQFIELDVRTTADGELVVIHDADLNRTTNGNGLIIDHNLAEIKSLDAGAWFRDGSRGYHVPTLTQMLDVVRGQAGIYIEVKHADPAKLLEEVNAAGMLDSCFFWGRDTTAMQILRELSPMATLMAPRWMYSSVKEAAAAYGAQIIEFDVTKDNLNEISDCVDIGVKSMVYDQSSEWEKLSVYLDKKPDLLNLDWPDRFKILSSYPNVYRHFLSMENGQPHAG